MKVAMDLLIVTLIHVTFLMTNDVRAFTELPKFSQLRLLYPGYPEYGGHYHEDKLIRFILGSTAVDEINDGAKRLDPGHDQSSSFKSNVHHHSAAVRLSYALNRYGGRHAIGTKAIQLTHHSSNSADSFPGANGLQYIFRNEAFGPYLAERYGNPEVVRTTFGGGNDDSSSSWPMLTFVGRQGIVRVVSYGRHSESGHVALWDCDRFHQSRDWSTGKHVIAVEFWESPDSHCPLSASGVGPAPLSPPTSGAIAAAPEQHLHVVARHNGRRPPYLHDTDNDDDTSRRRHGTDALSSQTSGSSSRGVRGRRRRERHDVKLWLQ